MGKDPAIARGVYSSGMKNSKNNKRILVVGANSLIGNALVSALNSTGNRVFSTSRREKLSESCSYLDLDQDVSGWPLPEKIDVAFLCAAYNSLDYCHREPLKTRQVNVVHTLKLAQRLVKAGARVIFLSTNLVFDGNTAFVKADAPLCPQTEHGRQKAQAERQLLALGDSITILRLTKVFWPKIELLGQWICALQNNKVIHPFSDKVVSPLPLSFAIQVLCDVVSKPIDGIVQVSGNRDVSYSQLAYRLAQRMGVSEDLVEPIRAQDSKLFLEHLPHNTTLDTTRLNEEFGMKAPDVWSGMDLMIDEKMGALESRIATADMSRR